MESKRNETFGKVIFGKKAIRETWSAHQEINEESTRQGGVPRGAPPTLVGSPGLSWPNSFTLGASFGPEKIIKNWHVNWTPFGIPFL